jgi:tetratricopeptide (TPR) repeat protein
MNSRAKNIFEKFSNPEDLSDMEDYYMLEDPVLSEKIDSYMKARTDLNDVMNDPSLDDARSETRELVNSYFSNSRHSELNKNFIKESLAELAEERKIRAEINEIRMEASGSAVNDTAASWVTEYNCRKEKEKDTAAKERKSFITESLKTDPIIEDTVTELPEKKRYITRYISLAAAAVIAAMLLIKSLAPSSDPEKIFKSYYEPFSTISNVTRGADNKAGTLYNSGLEFYRSGDFEAAGEAFKKAAATDANYGSPEFMLGMTYLEMGNYDEAAQQLSLAINNPGQYSKEARWYLGMACLRTGDIQKAKGLFKTLSESNGFYKERAQKILLRLK